MSVSRRRFLELSAAASALFALNEAGASTFAGQMSGKIDWVKSVCR
jgi:anaerobic selenocysteine-containing dehydrogenase